jgi:hypothetical protein
MRHENRRNPHRPVGLLTTALVMDLDGRKLHLHGALPRAKWTAGVHLGSALASESIHVPWPALDDGAMAPAIDLPERWPIGLLRISTIVLWDGTFAMLSLMARG